MSDMSEFLVYYRYNGVTNEFRFLAESEEHARERVLLFKSNKEDPRIHCNGHRTPAAEPAPSDNSGGKGGSRQ